MTNNLSEYLFEPEEDSVSRLLQSLDWPYSRKERVLSDAGDLVKRTRAAKRRAGELESFLMEFGLDTDEGLALMTLAESLLRIPDAVTADKLIRDKIAAVEWLSGQGDTADWLVKLASFGLSMSRKTLDSVVGRLGEPIIRKAVAEAMRLMGRQFVLGRDIGEAMKHAKPYEKNGYRMSYDMLGEGARTMADADRYFEAYSQAIETVGESEKEGIQRPGISVKLSALHPRYEYHQHDKCVPVLVERLGYLCARASHHDIALTVDSEEADRLEISMDIIEQVFKDTVSKDWDGFGLAVQAYQKRALPLIKHLGLLAKDINKRLQIRLVKGAYWDTEIKRAQQLGLPEYPVFTRKVHTDLSYMACAEELMNNRGSIYPMFATHNAHTVMVVKEFAGKDSSPYEFQRLHGMGETLYGLVLNDDVAPVSVYAPVGTHEDLLPYLVRRLLENGANTSFVNKLMDPALLVDEIIKDPFEECENNKNKRHPQIPLPKDIFKDRVNSAGLDITEATVIEPLLESIKTYREKAYVAAPIIGGELQKAGPATAVLNPADKSHEVGQVYGSNKQQINTAFETAKEGQKQWAQKTAEERAQILEKIADLYEENTEELLALCVYEAGKTIEDSIADLREAVDFCRYYAVEGRKDFAEEGTILSGVTGESNVLTLEPRGTFICISPWNFPLAIFTGQIAAALMAGNSVIAKPAEQTPIIATLATQLMIKAGVDPKALSLLIGDGKIGAQIVQHKNVSGVTFTGSDIVARLINRSLAAKDGEIVPLIAETGGLNCMIVDSSALPEQVIDDVILSAFNAAGQRCSALRVLYLQNEIADKVIEMLKGAIQDLRLGHPDKPSSDIGPVIDMDALNMLNSHKDWLDKNGKFVAAVSLDKSVAAAGNFFAPIAYEIDSVRQLEKEVFGPILHIVRYDQKNLDQIMDDINETGFGLTMGVHSRISTTARRIIEKGLVGNSYVNRSMIGAVVGVQAFGGRGLSGTGPKAGGPHYLKAFATEKLVSTDTTRQGGNASLVSLTE